MPVYALVQQIWKVPVWAPSLINLVHSVDKYLFKNKSWHIILDWGLERWVREPVGLGEDSHIHIWLKYIRKAAVEMQWIVVGTLERRLLRGSGLHRRVNNLSGFELCEEIGCFLYFSNMQCMITYIFMPWDLGSKILAGFSNTLSFFSPQSLSANWFLEAWRHVGWFSVLFSKKYMQNNFEK